MSKENGLIFSICVGFIFSFLVGWILTLFVVSTIFGTFFEKCIFSSSIGLIGASMIGVLFYLLTLFDSEPQNNVENQLKQLEYKIENFLIVSIEGKLEQIEYKLNNFFVVIECSKCRNKLSYHRNFTGQIQCRKCLSTMNIN